MYRGADARFTLYEDDGTTMHYVRRNASSTIGFRWDEASQALTIEARRGEGYPAMLRTRTLQLVAVQPGFGVGAGATAVPNRTLTYTGSQVTVSLQTMPA